MKISRAERLRDPEWRLDPFSGMYDCNEYFAPYGNGECEDAFFGPFNNTEYRLYKAMRLAKRQIGKIGK
jgi:hypothetical protein